VRTLATEPFLVDFHRRHPGATARAFGRGRTADGGNTYDLLADAVSGAGRVLDLGCGDGHLARLLADRGAGVVGVDIAEADVELARARGLANAEFHVARAQALPLSDTSVDAAVSHMTLMLMDEIDAVLAEVARVLRPGGPFVGVVGTHPRPDDAWGLYIALFRELFDAHGTGYFDPGDERVRDEVALAALLSGIFEAVSVTPVFVDLAGGVDEVWEFVSLSYLRRLVDEEGHRALEARWRAQVPGLAGPAGAIPCSLRLLRFDARGR